MRIALVALTAAFLLPAAGAEAKFRFGASRAPSAPKPAATPSPAKPAVEASAAKPAASTPNAPSATPVPVFIYRPVPSTTASAEQQKEAARAAPLAGVAASAVAAQPVAMSSAASNGIAPQRIGETSTPEAKSAPGFMVVR